MWLAVDSWVFANILQLLGYTNTYAWMPSLKCALPKIAKCFFSIANCNVLISYLGACLFWLYDATSTSVHHVEHKAEVSLLASFFMGVNYKNWSTKIERCSPNNECVFCNRKFACSMFWFRSTLICISVARRNSSLMVFSTPNSTRFDHSVCIGPNPCVCF